MLEQPVTIYEAVSEATAETTITDVLLGAVAVVLALVGVAILMGMVCAVILIGIRRMRHNHDPDDGDTDVTRLGLNSPTVAPGDGTRDS